VFVARTKPKNNLFSIYNSEATLKPYTGVLSCGANGYTYNGGAVYSSLQSPGAKAFRVTKSLVREVVPYIAPKMRQAMEKAGIEPMAVEEVLKVSGEPLAAAAIAAVKKVDARHKNRGGTKRKQPDTATADNTGTGDRKKRSQLRMEKIMAMLPP